MPTSVPAIFEKADIVARRLIQICLASVVIACGTFWYLQDWNVRLIDARTAVAPIAEPVTSLNGSEIRYPGITRTLDGAPRSSNQWSVVMVLSDTCPGCAKVLPVWERFLAEMDTTLRDVHVDILSAEGTSYAYRLGEILKRQNKHYQVASIINPPEFVAVTGIRSTPTLMVIDQDDRLRYKGTSLTQDDLAEVLSAMSKRNDIAE